MNEGKRLAVSVLAFLLVLVMFFDVADAKKKKEKFISCPVLEYTLKLKPSKKERKFKILRPENTSWSDDYYINIRDLSIFLSEIDLGFDVNYNKKAGKLTLASYLPAEQGMYFHEKGLKNKAKVKVKPHMLDVLVNDFPYDKLQVLEYAGKLYVNLSEIAKRLGLTLKVSKKTITLTSEIPARASVIKTMEFPNNFYDEGPTYGGTIYHDTYFKGNHIMVFGADTKEIWIREYSENHKLLNEKKVEKEGVFGGFLRGKDWNYILFGFYNRQESNTKTVFRIVKYDQDFNRIGSCDISNCYTLEPFYASTSDMAEKDGVLIVHTSRKRYLTEDGLNHQSQMTFIINSDTMTLMNGEDIGMFQENHVSHSFHQQVCIADNQYAYLLDHGDAYPRSLVLTKVLIANGNLAYHLIVTDNRREEYNRLAEWLDNHEGDETIPPEEYQRLFDEFQLLHDSLMEDSEYKEYKKEEVHLISFPSGENQTGLSVGNMVQGDRKLLIAVNHIDYSKAEVFEDFVIRGEDTDKRDIFVFVVDKENASDFREVRLTDYAKKKGKPVYSVPRIVPMGNDNYLVLWTEIKKNDKKDLHYLTINQEGKPLSEIKVCKDAEIGNTDPEYKDGKVVWTITDYRRSLLYELEVE